MAARPVAPVDARHLGRKHDGVAREGLLRARQHRVAVADERLRVPLEEELAVVGVPQAALVLEEGGVLAREIVGARVLRVGRPHEAAAGAPGADGGADQVRAHVAVVGLELPDARPVPQREGVGRVAHLPGGAQAHLRLDDDGRDLVAEVLHEGAHEVLVHIERGAAAEERLVVNAEGEVLAVAVQVRVCVEYVVVAVAHLNHPFG
mmetsp:Transcript_6927/g.21635  ORF Transcript_6927/g.21635 Transcript_6927/m.21635 type:complete len:206 (+) Transcript_6927:722-1339(+)